jgi:hypothetical protein
MKSVKIESSPGVATRVYPKHFGSFAEFYPFYLSEHRNRVCKFLHFIGLCLAQASLVGIILTGRWHLIWLPLVFAYGFAWIGHFGFEKNRPASFASLKFFAYSFCGDFHLWWHLLTGRLGFETNAELQKK